MADRRYNQTDDPFILADLMKMKLAPNYNSWLYQLISPYLGKRILEVGPGIGNLSHQIISSVELFIGLEPNNACFNYLNSDLENNPNSILINKKVEECSANDFSPYKIDTILCVNVLEHIADDLAILQKFYEFLPVSGKVIIFSPAIQSIYGPIDSSVGHFRRYSRNELINKLQAENFKIKQIKYSNIIGLLGWWFNAKFGNITQQNNHQISLFDEFVPIISIIEEKVSPPIGMSLLAIGEKI